MKRVTRPVVTVVIPIRTLSYYLLFENLPEMNRQIYKKFEVIVLPNKHTTYDITLMNLYSWLRIVPTGRVTRPAQKRDIGVQNARGKIIAFIDDDAYPDPSWLKEAVALFEKTKASAVCGPGMLPEGANIWEQIFDVILCSRLGAGKYSYRFTKGPKQYVIDYPSMNFLIYKKVFDGIGGFNSEYWPGEDSKLCNDLVYKKKGKILYSPKVLVHHHRRNHLMGFLHQHSQYGFHRGAFFAHGDRNSRELSYLIPTFFTLYLACATLYILAAVFGNYLNHSNILIILAPLYLYTLLALAFFIQSVLSTKKLSVSIGAVLVLVATHLIYGVNFIKGLSKGRSHESLYA